VAAGFSVNPATSMTVSPVEACAGAGSTILACGLSLLSVANTGEAQLRAVSLWGAAAAVGAAAGPLVGGVLVDITGWQGLFWIHAGVAVLCIVLTFFTVSESRDPNRPRSIDYAGSVLVALTLAPFILTVSKGGDWGWFSVATLVCFAVAIAAGLDLLPWNVASLCQCWTWRYCATGSLSAPRLRSSLGHAPSTDLCTC
jgi:MFS family permease